MASNCLIMQMVLFFRFDQELRNLQFQFQVILTWFILLSVVESEK
jgi:hypothetical protein